PNIQALPPGVNRAELLSSDHPVSPDSTTNDLFNVDFSELLSPNGNPILGGRNMAELVRARMIQQQFDFQPQRLSPPVKADHNLQNNVSSYSGYRMVMSPHGYTMATTQPPVTQTPELQPMETNPSGYPMVAPQPSPTQRPQIHPIGTFIITRHTKIYNQDFAGNTGTLNFSKK
ncbi:unnamed protein product, partial [Meganyctiphanes norvegica]